MEDLYRQSLDAAGYGHEEATEENVRSCFADYVDAGYWSNLSIDDELEEISTPDMCRALIHRRD